MSRCGVDQSGRPIRRSIGWLGDIPDHCVARLLKYLVEFSGGGTPAKNEAAFWAGMIPWVSPKDMKSEVIHDSEDHITEAAVRASATRLVPAGSILLVVRSGILRHTIPVAIAARRVALNQDMKALIPRRDCEPRYLKYVIQGRQHALLLAWTKTGATVQSIEHELLANTLFPVPPLEEQRAIADFLDEKTAAVDALIAKKEKLVGLLDERHQKFVSERVVRDRRPATERKRSQFEWIGEIPKHWTVTRLRHVVPQVTVGIVVTPSRYYVDAGVPCLRSLNIQPTRIDARELVYISPESNELHRKSMIHEGDLVAVRTGNPGTTALVDARFNGGNAIDLIIVRRSPQYDSRFLCYFMNSEVARYQYESGSEGALQLHFNVETAKDLLIPLPPLVEQREIAADLDRAMAAHERVVGRIRSQIHRLREYRRTLISAAVTGRLDVRRAQEVPA